MSKVIHWRTIVAMIKALLQKHLNTLAWLLAAATVAIGFAAWGQHQRWQLNGLSTYEIFPVFGLIAFSLMWCHFVIAGIKSAFGFEQETTSRRFFEATAWVVLAALLLHPGLLIWQLWRDGFGLPPSSYINNYVAPGLAWAAYLGTVSWLTFMSFELRRWYREKHWWKYVIYANDAAIWGVYIHGLKLGRDVGAPWLLYVWWVYGIVLAFAFVAIYRQRFFNKAI